MRRLPGGPASEPSPAPGRAPETDAQAEAAKLQTCEKISQDIYGLFCADLQKRVTEAGETEWIDVMKAVFP